MLNTKSIYIVGGCWSGTVSTELPGRYELTQGHGYKWTEGSAHSWPAGMYCITEPVWTWPRTFTVMVADIHTHTHTHTHYRAVKTRQKYEFGGTLTKNM